MQGGTSTKETSQSRRKIDKLHITDLPLLRFHKKHLDIRVIVTYMKEKMTN